MKVCKDGSHIDTAIARRDDFAMPHGVSSLVPAAFQVRRRWMVVALGLSLLGCDRGWARANGDSMAPAMTNGQEFPFTRTVDRVERGEVIAFYYPPDHSKSFMKRVVGLPGEEVLIRKGAVSIDGRALDEPYVLEANRSHEDYGPYIVPADTYFVLGDNRRGSSDSRHWNAIPKNVIWGKVLLR